MKARGQLSKKQVVSIPESVWCPTLEALVVNQKLGPWILELIIRELAREDT